MKRHNNLSSKRPSWFDRLMSESWKRKHSFDIIVCIILGLVVLITHAWNMTSYPYIENDEATYISRGLHFIETGKMDVYTYRYDHAPLGWIAIGAWLFLNGGDHSMYGSLMNSGRFFMVIVAIATTVLLYHVILRMTRSRVAAIVGCLVFAVSPLAIYFHRRVLLDNIMTFWTVLSLFVISKKDASLRDYIVSGILLGIATLTKLNAVFFLPALLFIAWRNSDRAHRVHATAYWLLSCGFIIVSFFIYSLLKGEFFSAPIGANGLPTHVSLIDTFGLQLGRGGEALPPWNPESSFYTSLQAWLLKDRLLMIGGGAALVITLIIGWFRRRSNPLYLGIPLLAFCMVLFLIRGKLVMNLYITPLLPLFGAMIGMVVAWLYELLRKSKSARVALIASVFAGMSWYYIFQVDNRHYLVEETKNQLDAITWMKKNVNKNAIIVGDNYIYPYLVDEHAFKNVSYFFPAEYDPEIKKTYQEDWRNLDYLVVTHEVYQQMKEGSVPQMREAFLHSEMVAEFKNPTTSYIQTDKFISTNGDWAAVYRIKSRPAIILQDAQSYLREHYFSEYGRITNPSSTATTAGDQAYGMELSLEAGRKADFEGIWGWTRDHLRYRPNDALISSTWDTVNGSQKATITTAPCEANQRIIATLIGAAVKWENSSFKAEAVKMAAQWRGLCTNTDHVLASAANDTSIVPDLSVFDPALYRSFEETDSTQNWQAVINTGYDDLSRSDYIQSAALDQRYARLISNVAKDYLQTSDPRALEPLQKALARLSSAPEEPWIDTALAAALQATGEYEKAQDIYIKRIAPAYHKGEGHWRDSVQFTAQQAYTNWHYLQEDIPKTKQKIEVQ